MRFEGKNKTVLFFIFLFIPSVALFGLTGSRNISDYITTSFYISISIAALVVLALTKSDDKYYKNLGPTNLLGAIVLALLMTTFSLILSFQLGNRILLSVGTLSLTPTSSSVSTNFLSLLVYGLVFVATAEELLKLPMFAEGKARWGNGYKITKKLVIPGVLIYVGVPVSFWAALHGILAYSDPIMILPAAFNGVLLIIYLWKTECFLGCVFAHFLYNGFIILVTFINGTAGIPAGTPFFPPIFSGSYYSNSGFIYDLLLFLIIVIAVALFLIPSLTRDKSTFKSKKR